MEFDPSLSLEENTNVLSKRALAAIKLIDTPAVLVSGISGTKRTLMATSPSLSRSAMIAMLASVAASCVESEESAKTMLDDCLEEFHGVIDRGTPRETTDEDDGLACQTQGAGDANNDEPQLLQERVKTAVDNIGPVAIVMAQASDGTVVTEYPSIISDKDLAWMAGSVLDYLVQRGLDLALAKSAFTKCFRQCVKKNEGSRHQDRKHCTVTDKSMRQDFRVANEEEKRMDLPNDMPFEQQTATVTERMIQAGKALGTHAVLAGGLPDTGWSACIGSKDLTSAEVISMLAVLVASRVQSRAHAKELLNACLDDVDTPQVEHLS